ncbi:Zinc finger BED domain-containing protein 5 [Eumeta japonica]|uniref:Zinc finger BED domain-containing protein 5 n=1 Tax=Eumeta variegata TaxID=151549 RepID=A0A4C2A8M0_EUMVA|nr:Zinc finger BED domain-containing protein 5 [Eumeta japonica]
MIHTTQIVNEKDTAASHLLKYRVAKTDEVPTIAENLIKPFALDIIKRMLDDKSAKHLSTVPLSNDTVSCRIHDLASYVKQELIAGLQEKPFALQLDESTNIAGLAILLGQRRLQYNCGWGDSGYARKFYNRFHINARLYGHLLCANTDH